MESGKYYGNYLGEWLGAQATDPNALYGSLSFSVSVTGSLDTPGGFIEGLITFSVSATAQVVQEVTGGSGKRPKRVYLEREGQILVFNKPTDAAAYIAAEKAQEVEPVQKYVQKKKPKVVSVKQPEVIKFDVLAMLAQKFAIPDFRTISTHDHEALYALHRKVWEMQDEEDIELLLLAA